jgi:hypothetical protein
LASAQVRCFPADPSPIIRFSYLSMSGTTCLLSPW